MQKVKAKKRRFLKGKKRTPVQNRKMFGLKSKIGLEHEDLREMAYDITNGETEHTSELTIEECDKLIARLESFLPKEEKRSPRTIRYHRQKAGVVNINVAKQWKTIQDLWLKFPHRRLSGLEKICLRTIKKPKPLTTKEANKIFEAVKSMNQREEAKSKPQPATGPKNAA